MQILSTGKFDKSSKATNVATGPQLSLYGTLGSGAIYTATSTPLALTASDFKFAA